MRTSWSGIEQELRVGTTAARTQGVSLPYQRLESFAEAEMRYREARLLAEAQHRHWQPVGQEKSQAQSGGMVTRWITWLSSVLPRRSSPESASSSACAS